MRGPLYERSIAALDVAIETQFECSMESILIADYDRHLEFAYYLHTQMGICLPIE